MKDKLKHWFVETFVKPEANKIVLEELQELHKMYSRNIKDVFRKSTQEFEKLATKEHRITLSSGQKETIYGLQTLFEKNLSSLILKIKK